MNEIMYDVTSYSPVGTWGDYDMEEDWMTETEVCRLLTDYDIRTDEDSGRIEGEYIRKDGVILLNVRRL